MKSCVVALSLIIGLALMPTSAAAQGVPADILTKLAIKVIGFDQNASRYGSPIKIGVSSDALLSAFEAVKTLQINGRAFTAAKFGSAADVGKFDVVFVGAGQEGLAAAVAAAAKSGKILTLSETSSGVSKGLAVGFFVQDGKPKIAISPANVAACGASFPETLLRVSTVIG